MTLSDAMLRARRNHELYGGQWTVWTRHTEGGTRQLWIRAAEDGSWLPKGALLAYEYPKAK